MALYACAEPATSAVLQVSVSVILASSLKAGLKAKHHRPVSTEKMKGLILLAVIALAYSNDVRLVDKDGQTNDQQGRIQVFLNGNWGEVCGDYFGKNDAKVVCKELGHSSNGKIESGDHGIGGEGIVIGDVNCNGDESSLLDCTYT